MIQENISSPHGLKASAHRPVIMGQNGMVASGHPLASQTGIRILMQGGNAIDAAIATAAALNVVEPHMSGIGGDGFLLIFWAKTGRIEVVNATGPAPRMARRERFVRDGIPSKGILSVSVPGLVDGWCLAHERYGALSLTEVLEPASDLAESGFPINHKLAQAIHDETPSLSSIPISQEVYAPTGRLLQAGECLAQPALARNASRRGTC